MSTKLSMRRRCSVYAENEPLAPPVIFCTQSQNSTTPIPPSYCVGDVIRLYCEPVPGATSYYWIGPSETDPVGWHSSGNRVARGNSKVWMSGTYYCTVNANGQSAVSKIDVELQTFLYEQNGERTVNFTSYVNNSSSSARTYEWDFGDGTKSTEDNPTHKYASAGVYTVNLEVTDNGSIIKRGSRDVVVE